MMIMTELIKVHDPKKPGDFLLVNQKTFNAGEYKLFSEPLKAKTEKAAPKKPAVKRASNKSQQNRKP